VKAQSPALNKTQESLRETTERAERAERNSLSSRLKLSTLQTHKLRVPQRQQVKKLSATTQ
jgi:hypothetical protein